nr:MAG TPA: hypothetical protein [Caudoviricetes sp.]
MVEQAKRNLFLTSQLISELSNQKSDSMNQSRGITQVL